MQDVAWPSPDAKYPYLEYYPEQTGSRQRIPINRSPFRIGRSKSAHYIIYSNKVSKEHAEITLFGENARIRDLGSTNGTFVNGQRVMEGPLVNGDIVHIAHEEYRFVYDAAPMTNRSEASITLPAKSDLPASLIRGGKHLRELLEKRSVLILFQPILHLETRDILGFEALARSTHLALNLNPSELFHLAKQCKLAPELSLMLRAEAGRAALELPGHTRVFMNLHPSEKIDDQLIDSLNNTRMAMGKGRKMVLEVHEDLVTDLETIRWLGNRLKQVGIELAYDDFGTGQSRLAELAELPPRFVKLAMDLIRGINGAPARRELVQALSRGITDLGAELIAEGLETLEEAQVCQSLACHYGQGYLLGRPEPASQLAKR